jgi:hypothetical protein
MTYDVGVVLHLYFLENDAKGYVNEIRLINQFWALCEEIRLLNT